MAKKNVIEIEYKGTRVVAKVWDADGVSHDITPIFDKITGATGNGTLWSRVSLKNKAGGSQTITEIGFVPGGKELKFEVTEDVIRQILSL